MYRHMNPTETQSVKELIDICNKTINAEPLIMLIDLKKSLLDAECYEMLSDLKEMEEENNCPIPFSIGV